MDESTLNTAVAQNLQTAVDQAPQVAYWLLAAAALAGLAIWLLGRKLARPLCALSGLLAGAAVAFALPLPFALGEGLPETLKQLVWMLALALIGAIAAWMLFRVWMGLTCAVVLAIALPVATLGWQGAPAKPAPEDAADMMIQDTTPPPPPEANEDGDAADDAEAELIAQAKHFIRAQVAAARQWWDDREKGARRIALVAAAVGTLAGLIAGIVFPHGAAGFQTALVGSTLMVLSAAGLLNRFGDGELSWPRHPPTLLLATGLITVAGMLIQWTIFRRRADS